MGLAKITQSDKYFDIEPEFVPATVLFRAILLPGQ